MPQAWHGRTHLFGQIAYNPGIVERAAAARMRDHNPFISNAMRQIEDG
jgi:hypothetical protein